MQIRPNSSGFFPYVMEHGTYYHFIHYIYILCKKYTSDSSSLGYCGAHFGGSILGVGVENPLFGVNNYQFDPLKLLF